VNCGGVGRAVGVRHDGGAAVDGRHAAGRAAGRSGRRSGRGSGAPAGPAVAGGRAAACQTGAVRRGCSIPVVRRCLRRPSGAAAPAPARPAWSAPTVCGRSRRSALAVRPSGPLLVPPLRSRRSVAGLAGAGATPASGRCRSARRHAVIPGSEAGRRKLTGHRGHRIPRRVMAGPRIHRGCGRPVRRVVGAGSGSSGAAVRRDHQARFGAGGGTAAEPLQRAERAQEARRVGRSSTLCRRSGASPRLFGASCLRAVAGSPAAGSRRPAAGRPSVAPLPARPRAPSARLDRRPP
jgi:hypothetical protein